MTEPLRRFFAWEAASGLMLAAATLVALVWANSPVRDAYVSLWTTPHRLSVGSWTGTFDLAHAVNDGLMALFFFVIGAEIAREWRVGELRDRRAALLPIVAALGGIAVPALVYSVLVGSAPGGHGWGIPMATDIAFAVGVVVLLGHRVPAALKLFLLTLAIVDDLGAILVIAVFYAGSIDPRWLAVAAAGLLGVVLLGRGGVRQVAPYGVLGLLVWWATLNSGVHATIAGVALAFVLPTSTSVADDVAEDVAAEGVADDLAADATVGAVEAPDSGVDAAAVTGDRGDEIGGDDTVADGLDRLPGRLHPWTSLVVVPVFALANAGVVLSAEMGPDGRRVATGAAVGLVLGKCLGISGACWLVVRAGLARLPRGASWLQVVAMSLLAGIGFTMSLLITELAFSGAEHPVELASAAKTGVLAGSVIAAVAGAALMTAAMRPRRLRPRTGGARAVRS